MVSSVAIGNGGEHIVPGSGNCLLRICKRETGKCGGESLRGNIGGVSSVAIRSNGERTVSGPYDKNVADHEEEDGKACMEVLART